MRKLILMMHKFMQSTSHKRFKLREENIFMHKTYAEVKNYFAKFGEIYA